MTLRNKFIHFDFKSTYYSGLYAIKMAAENEEKKKESSDKVSDQVMLTYPPGLPVLNVKQDDPSLLDWREGDGTALVHPKIGVRNKISTSYGLIVFTYNKEGKMLFLMTQRRDTFSYECILRGLYTLELLPEYVMNMTRDERARFSNHNFDTLWKDLWVSTKRRLYRMEYKKASEIFEKNYQLILSLIEECPAFGKDIWEFPKGKMFSEETTYQCALREFEEETHIKKSNITIVKEAGSYEDHYEGTDHNMYRSVYYLGYIPRGCDIPIHYLPCQYNVRTRYISDEVMDLKWISAEDTLERCSDSKKRIVQSIVDFLR